MQIWEFLDARMTPEHLGLIPYFLQDEDEASASEQFARNYIGGWQAFPGFKLDDDNRLHYSGDPPLQPRAQTKLRDELIVFYDYAWVAIIQPDRSFEVCRMD